MVGTQRTALAKRLGERKKAALQACRALTAAQPPPPGSADDDAAAEVDAAVDSLEHQFAIMLTVRGGASASAASAEAAGAAAPLPVT